MSNKVNNNGIFNENPFTLLEMENVPVGLRQIHKLLILKSWKNRINQDGYFVYSKDTDIFDEFRIKIDNKNIQVSIPLPNSEFLYKCNFDSYFEASEFIEQHLHNYEISKKTSSLYDEIKKGGLRPPSTPKNFKDI